MRRDATGRRQVRGVGGGAAGPPGSVRRGVASRVAGGDVAEVSIDGFRLGPRVRAGLHALKGGLGLGSVDVGFGIEGWRTAELPERPAARTESGRRSAGAQQAGLRDCWNALCALTRGDEGAQSKWLNFTIRGQSEKVCFQ